MKTNIKNLIVYIPCLILLISILVLFFNLKISTSKMIKDLDIISQYVKSESWEISKNLFDNFYNQYRSKIENFSIILRNDEVDKALISISDIFLNIELEDRATCLNKIENLKFYISNLYISQIPNLKNIL